MYSDIILGDYHYNDHDCVHFNFSQVFSESDGPVTTVRHSLWPYITARFIRINAVSCSVVCSIKAEFIGAYQGKIAGHNIRNFLYVHERIIREERGNSAGDVVLKNFLKWRGVLWTGAREVLYYRGLCTRQVSILQRRLYWRGDCIREMSMLERGLY